MRKTMTVELAGVRFERAEFLNGARESINGREAMVKDITGRETFTFRPLGGKDLGQGFLFRRQETDPEGQVSEPLISLLRESATAREDVLRGSRWMFDMPGPEFEQLVADVASTEDATRRMDKAEEARSGSGEYYYRELYNKLSATFQREDLMPPSPDTLLRHFRLAGSDTGDSMPEQLSKAAEALLRTETLETVINRLSRFPIPLPAIVLDRALLLTDEGKEKLVRRLVKTVGSPISVFHFASILQTLGESRFRRLARRTALRFLGEASASEFTAFKSVLLWCVQEFKIWPRARTMPSKLRLALAWAHAHQVFVSFKAVGSPMDWLGDAFDTFSNRVRFGPVDLESSLRADVSHPVHFTRVSLLLGGLHYAFMSPETEPLPKIIAERFSELAIVQTEVGPFPSMKLLLDSRLAENQLDVFWGRDRQTRLLSMLPERDLELARAILAEITVQQVLTGLESHNQEEAWWTRLYAVVGSFAVPADLMVRFRQVVLRTDFAALTARHLETGYVALHIASMQSRHMAAEVVRDHLAKSLWATAAIFEDQKEIAKEEDVAMILLDCALNIAQCAPPEGRVYDEFARITGRLIRCWHVIGQRARTGIQRLCEEIPFSEDDHLWQLNLILRCRR